ncbi:hypothetical protein [Nostoc sp.]
MDDIVCCDACGGKLRSIISYDQFAIAIPTTKGELCQSAGYA